MNRLLIIGILLMVIGPVSLLAQLEAPALLCVSNDTLVWDIPTVSCATPDGYRILASESESGPYSELATITDLTQTSFFHADAGIATWFYYMETIANCPGTNPAQSDTLDNRNPEVPLFRYVSVEDGQVVMEWDASPSPEVIAYVISRNTNMGTSIIDTVPDGLMYTDLNASPEAGKETYFVVAIDACGNASLTAPLHETIFLETNALDSCEQAIELSWNLYQNWDGGIADHTILLSENGGAFNPIATVPGNASSYVFDQARGEVLYCFKVVAAQTGTNVTSSSNETCTSISVVDPVDQLNLLNVSLNLSNEFIVDWQINANAEIFSADLQSETESVSTQQSLLTNGTFTADNTFLDVLTDPSQTFSIFSISTEDRCGEIRNSNTVQTIFLTAEASNDATNQLQWSPYINGLQQSLEYEIYRIVDGVETLVSVESSGTLSLNDQVSVDGATSPEICYYVLAKARIELPGGELRSVVSRSNTVCVMPIAPFFIPNVFAPEGVNQVFRPALAFGMLEEYQLDVFDRWGGHVFLSRDIEVGWDGRSNGEPLATGVYIYRIQWRQTGGELREVAGDVMLLR